MWEVVPGCETRTRHVPALIVTEASNAFLVPSLPWVMQGHRQGDVGTREDI